MKIISKVVLLSFLTGLLLMSAKVVGIFRSTNYLYLWTSLVCWTIFVLAASVLFALSWYTKESLSWNMPVMLKKIMMVGATACALVFLMIPGMIFLIPPMYKLFDDKFAWDIYYRILSIAFYSGGGIVGGVLLFTIGIKAIKYRKKQ